MQVFYSIPAYTLQSDLVACFSFRLIESSDPTRCISNPHHLVKPNLFSRLLEYCHTLTAPCWVFFGFCPQLDYCIYLATWLEGQY